VPALGLLRKVICPIDVVGMTEYGGQDTETAWSFNSTKYWLTCYPNDS
jgi:hypothetical protein